MKPSRRKTYSSATSVSLSRGRRRGRRSPDSQGSVSFSETQTSGTSKTTTTSREHNYHSSTDVADSNDDKYHDEEEEDDDESGTGNQSSSPAPSAESSPRTSPAIVSDEKGRVCVPSTNTAYVNVAPLPIFHGRTGECPVEHLARFARVCRANNAAAPDAMARIFSVTLEDEAALWYELEVESRPSGSTPATWEETNDAFLLAFRRPDFAERLRTELVTTAQSDGESAYGYYLRMQWILKRWPGHGLPELMLKGIFLDGLREDFRDWIIPQRPNTLEEALRMAMVWEQAEAMKMARRRRIEEELSSAAAKMRNINVVKSCGFCGGDGHEESGCEVKKKLRELWLTTARLKSFKDNNGNGAAMANSMKKGCRSLSLTTNIMRRQGEGEVEGLALGSNDHKPSASQCRCWKHQCGKKNNSFVITDSNL